MWVLGEVSDCGEGEGAEAVTGVQQGPGVAELVTGLSTAGDRGLVSGVVNPEFGQPLVVFDRGGPLPGAGCFSGHVRVDRVTLAEAAAVGPVRAGDLDHTDPSSMQDGDQASTVGRTPLDTSQAGSVLEEPVTGLVEAVQVGGELAAVDRSAIGVDQGDLMGVGMSVDTGYDISHHGTRTFPRRDVGRVRVAARS